MSNKLLMPDRHIHTEIKAVFYALIIGSCCGCFFDSAPKVRQESFLMILQRNKKWPREQ